MRKLLRTDLGTKVKYIKNQNKKKGVQIFLKLGLRAEFQVAAQKEESC